jgi:ectoine hydroxylase-related dioxygenase (phytanoyl-CoA dioxygenase family)
MNPSAEINENGFTILKNIIDSETKKNMQFYSDLLIERTLKRHGDSGNVVFNLYRSENIASDFLITNLLTNENVYEILSEVFKSNFHLLDAYIHFSLPGSVKQELHLDVNHIFKTQLPYTPPFQIAVHYPLCKFDNNSGGTRIIPKSHKELCKPPQIENEIDSWENHIVQANLGDCFIRDCRAWHGAGANKTNEIRAMFSFSFGAYWFLKPAKASKDLYFSLPKSNRHFYDV